MELPTTPYDSGNTFHLPLKMSHKVITTERIDDGARHLTQYKKVQKLNMY